MHRVSKNRAMRAWAAGALAILGLTAPAGAGLPSGAARGRGGAAAVLTTGRQVANLKGYAGSESHFKILVPAGGARLTVQTLGGTGDADLYVRFSTAPTRSAFAHRSTGRGNTEVVTVDSPRAGWWRVMVHGSSNYSGLRLTATVTPAAAPRRPELPDPADIPNIPRGVLRLAPGKGMAGLSGNEGSRRYFQIIVPGRAKSVTISTAGGSGDCDLFLRRARVPDLQTHEYDSNSGATDEAITVRNPAAGAWYVLLYGVKGFEDVSLGLTVRGAPDPRAARGPLEVVAPAAGEALRAGATRDLRWRSLEQRGRVRVLQSYDAGLSWSDIAPASVVDIRKGELRWTVPYSIRGKGGETIFLRLLGLDDRTLLVDAGPFRVTRRGPVPRGPQPRGPAGAPKGVSDADYRLGRYADAHEPDTREKPAPISLGKAQRHTIHPQGDEDWIAFKPAGPGKYRVTVSDVRGEIQFVVYTGAAGDGKLTDIYQAGVKAKGWSADVDVDRSIAFLLFRAAAGKSGEAGPYTVTVRRVNPAPHDKPDVPGPEPRHR